MTAEWWQEINPNEDQDVPILLVKKFFTSKGISPDLDSAEKTIVRKLGHKAERLEFSDFYKLFCLSIFKVALVDMLIEIEKMSMVNQELPLVIKLAAYRRARLLSGLDNSASAEQRAVGQDVLKALERYLTETNPRYFKKVKKAVVFDSSCLKSAELTPAERLFLSRELSVKSNAYFGMKSKAAELGVDCGPIEAEIKSRIQDASSFPAPKK